MSDSITEEAVNLRLEKIKGNGDEIITQLNEIEEGMIIFSSQLEDNAKQCATMGLDHFLSEINAFQSEYLPIKDAISQDNQSYKLLRQKIDKLQKFLDYSNPEAFHVPEYNKFVELRLAEIEKFNAEIFEIRTWNGDSLIEFYRRYKPFIAKCNERVGNLLKHRSRKRKATVSRSCAECSSISVAKCDGCSKRICRFHRNADGLCNTCSAARHGM